MKFTRHTKMIIGQATTIACSCMLVGICSVADGAIFAAQQDHDEKKVKVIEIEQQDGDQDENVEVIVIGEDDSGHEGLLKKLKKKHNVEIKRLPGDQDEDVEVVVIGEGGTDHKALLKKLKGKHKINIKQLHGDHAGDVEVVVIQDDEHQGDVKKMIHGHVVDLLHGHGSDQADYHEMANQLRRIADRLDGKGHSGHKKHKHHEDVEIHHGGNHGVHVWKHAGSDENEDVQIITKEGKRFQIRKSGQPHEKMIIEIDPEGNPEVHSLHGDQKLWLHRAQDHDEAYNVFVEKMHDEEKRAKHDKELYFEDAATSEESDWSQLEELKAELDALRDELRQLRSKRPDQRKQRVRRKKDQSSLDINGDNPVWVAKDDVESSGNTFVWRPADGSIKQDSPNRFRFEFKKKDDDDK